MVTYKIICRSGSRPVNEDCTGMHQVGRNYGFFLADGLGGHGLGDAASKLAVEQAILQFEAGECSEMLLHRIFQAGQEAILLKQQSEGMPQKMKTTMTALLISDTKIYLGHVGDSRIYYFDNGRLSNRTMDHSVPQMLVMAGQIQDHEIRNHPDRNRLLRVMGIPWDYPAYQIAEPLERRGNQVFLMCSDGFWELVNEYEMEQTLNCAFDVEDWMEEMEYLVQLHGQGTDMDNYSAVAIWIHT